MLTPFNARDDWEMGVQRVGDTGCIHLQVRETARKAQEEAARDERQQRMCYWGYRFEQLSTSGRPDGRGGSGGGGGGRGGGYRTASPSDLSSDAPLLGEGGLSEADAHRLKAAYAQLQTEEAPGGAGGGEGAVNANEEFCAVRSMGLTLLSMGLTLLSMGLTLLSMGLTLPPTGRTLTNLALVTRTRTPNPNPDPSHNPDLDSPPPTLPLTPALTLCRCSAWVSRG